MLCGNRGHNRRMPHDPVAPWTAGRRGPAGPAAPGGRARARRETAGETEAGGLQAMLERDAGSGDKASGGPGDTASGDWLEAELTTRRLCLPAAGFPGPVLRGPRRPASSAARPGRGDPQAMVAPTGPQGPDRSVAPGVQRGDLSGAIALVVLPYKRWVALGRPPGGRPAGRGDRSAAPRAWCW